MSLLQLPCSFCNKEFFRYSKHVWENVKLGHKSFCSPKCLAESRKRRGIIQCENVTCAKFFERLHSDLSKHNYCSRSCAVTVNNKKFPKNPAIKKTCPVCKSIFTSKEKFCSVTCKVKQQTLSPEHIIYKIKLFHQKHGRIPLKREFPHEVAARRRFGSWNKAVLTAGFKPNQVLFSKKYTAKDDHSCDSLAEMLIDNWFFGKGVAHQRNKAYPGNPTLTVDFVVGDYWIEFFGLYGQHRRYDELRKEKLLLAEQYNLRLIALYPYHLFPKNKLEEIFLKEFRGHQKFR